MTDKCNWRGISGIDYAFKIFDVGTMFKAVPAVYIFCKKINGHWAAIYIGQTKDLSERFDNHHKMPEIKRYGATHIHVSVNENGEKARKHQESDLIANYNPPLNEKA